MNALNILKTLMQLESLKVESFEATFIGLVHLVNVKTFLMHITAYQHLVCHFQLQNLYVLFYLLFYALHSI